MATSTAKSAPQPTAVRRRPTLDFSLTGLVYCSMMMFMGLAAINSQVNLLFGVFGLMIGILLVSGVVSRKVLRKLHVRRQLPDHAMVGAPVTATYEFANRKWFWPSLSVTVAELDSVDGFTRQPQCYMLHAAAGTTATVPTEIIPKRRGLLQLDRFQVSTSFPFGFIKRAVNDRAADKLLVYPAIGRVDSALIRMCMSAEKSGPSMRPRRGGSDEFYGVKEYRPGENPRRIYWRRSARTASTGVLVSKELTQVAPPRLMLLVDTHAGDRSPERYARIEKAIAMAASLAARALDEDLPVGLFAWSDGWKRIEATRGKRHRGDLLSVLARLPMNTAHPSADLLANAGRYIGAGTTAILFTPEDRGAGLEQRTGQNPMLVIPSASDSAAGWFKFESQVDFTTSMPFGQVDHGGLGEEGRVLAKKGRRRRKIGTLPTNSSG